LPQSTNYLAQRAAFYKFAVVLCSAEIHLLTHTCRFPRHSERERAEVLTGTASGVDTGGCSPCRSPQRRGRLQQGSVPAWPRPHRTSPRCLPGSLARDSGRQGGRAQRDSASRYGTRQGFCAAKSPLRSSQEPATPSNASTLPTSARTLCAAKEGRNTGHSVTSRVQTLSLSNQNQPQGSWRSRYRHQATPVYAPLMP